MNNFSITVSSPSYVSNITHLEKLAEEMCTNALAIDLSFGILKIKLMYWGIPKQRGLENTPPVTIRGNTFHSKDKIKWLDY